MALGNRLETALAILENCHDRSVFADIGSDHAFFAIEAKKRGIVANAIASDINKLPLEKGRENAELQGIEIDFVLSDGFDNIENKSVTVGAVCGMGGELISKMVIRSRTAHNCDLILQPMSAQEELRKSLWDNGFFICSETFVVDCKKPYTIMKVRFTGENTDYSYNDLHLGKERNNTAEFSEYCKKIKSAAEKRRLGIISKSESTEEIDGLIDECTKIINGAIL